MKKPAVVAAVALATFLLAVYGPRFRNPLPGVVPGQLGPVAYSLYMALWWLGLLVLALAGLYGFRRMLPELGWRASVGTGLLMGLVCTLPMLLGYLALFPVTGLAGPVVAGNLVRGALCAGLGEETRFRGFLFGQRYRKVRFPWLLTISATGSRPRPRWHWPGAARPLRRSCRKSGVPVVGGAFFAE